MTGLLLIAVVIVWVTFSLFIAKLVVQSIKSPIIKVAISVPVFSMLMVAPIADELIGAQQFKALCEKNGRRESEFSAISGKTVVAENGVYEPVNGTLLDSAAMLHTFSDPDSGSPLLKFYGYRSKGGWLIRMLGISEDSAPLLFNNTCGPFGDESVQGWLDRYQIKTISKK